MMSSRRKKQKTEHRSDAEDFVLRPVKPSHDKTRDGVRFNVQTVTPVAEPLELLTDDEVTFMLKSTAQRFYQGSVSPRKWPDVTIEAHSAPLNLTDEGPNDKSLIHVALTAFAKHFPLVLAPEDIWLAIATGAATHINHKDNAEKLRDKFVRHKGKQELEIRKDDIIMGSVPNQVWERDIFRGFSEQIRSHIDESAHDMFTKRFSATTKAQQAAMDITLMAAMKEYFSFLVTTRCGIPWIELKGTRKDWVGLRERASELGNFLLPKFASQWLPHLLPVLDQFILAYDGTVNHEFWQRMCKVVRGSGSGASDRVSGWVNNLYPYLKSERRNSYVKPWKEMSTMRGPDPNEFPLLLSSVPVVWDYYNVKYPLHFHAGYLGMTQDPDSLALSPYVGWVITHDPDEIKERKPLLN